MTVKIVLDHAGMDALLKSPEIQSQLQSVAQSKASKLAGNYKVSTQVQRTRAAAKIEPADRKTRNHVLKHNDLIKAVK